MKLRYILDLGMRLLTTVVVILKLISLCFTVQESRVGHSYQSPSSRSEVALHQFKVSSGGLPYSGGGLTDQ